MSNITYMRDFIDRRNELDDSIETEGMKIIRKNMKEYDRRKKKVDALIKEANRRAIPKT